MAERSADLSFSNLHIGIITMDIQTSTDFINALIALIAALGTLMTAITHAVAVIPKDKFGAVYAIFKLLAGNYGHAENINHNEDSK